MSFLRLALAALAVAAWFTGWAWGEGRVLGATSLPRHLRELTEAALLTAFAALWFASLGHGGWWLLFAVLGCLVEGPVRARHRADGAPEPRPWRACLLGTLRFLGAGLVLSLLL